MWEKYILRHFISVYGLPQVSNYDEFKWMTWIEILCHTGGVWGTGL